VKHQPGDKLMNGNIYRSTLGYYNSPKKLKHTDITQIQSTEIDHNKTKNSASVSDNKK